MPTYTMEMVLEHAKVFEQNADLGNAESSEKWLRELAKAGGQTAVNAYFTSEDQIEELIQGGFERMALNPKTKIQVDRIKDGNPEFGIGKYISLKRKVNDVREFMDKSGQMQTLDLGGYPKVVDLRDIDNKKMWSFEEDGELGHGTRAMVKFEMYKGVTLRLEAIGVTDLVAYKRVEKQDDELFKVA